MLEDGEGNLWMTGDRGISYAKKSELEEVAFGKRARVESVALGTGDGMKSAECNRRLAGGR